MLPPVVISQVRDALLDYLRTTFRLRDQALEAALFAYLTDPDRGLFRGPYLDVRLPFRKADPDADIPLDVRPPFTPFLHQLRAFQRLSSRDDHRPEPTLITTGTGSGKTECFLYPLLDHCRRARQRGDQGIKAILLYPMNALASDQAERIARELHRLKLGISAGLYVGGKGQHKVPGPTHLVDDRDELRKSPPDILLTNYRMLDFLLLRPEDRSLWERNQPTSLQYLVLDELHTYDGAQGSDVACLIRRLKDRLGIPEGHLCCVGTSATIGSGAEEPRRLLLEFASKVFGERFDEASVLGEERETPKQAFPDEVAHHDDPIAIKVGEVDPLDPEHEPERYLDRVAQRWVGAPARGRVLLGELLAQHSFLRRFLDALRGRDGAGGPRHWLEVADALGAADPAFAELPRERQWLVLASFVSLLAHARREEGGREIPFLNVQVQLWVRELHGLVRLVSSGPPRFAWRDDLEAQPGEHWLPMVYCRDCGHSGLGATQIEAAQELRDNAAEIGEAYLRSKSTARFVTLGAVPEDGRIPEYLCPRCMKRLEGMQRCDCAAGGTACIPVEIRCDLTEERRFRADCPRCGADGALSMLASRDASLSSVAVSRLFLSPYNDDRKLLAFTDSVQDASHRAGFFAGRTFRFTMRTAIQAVLEAAGDTALAELPQRILDHWVEKAGEAKAIASLMPPDLREQPAYQAFREAEKLTKKVLGPARALLFKRLGWEVTREYGLAVNIGRSLDSTGCSTLAPDEARIEEAARKILAYLIEERPVYPKRKLEPAEVRHFLAGLLQRLRLRGGIHHPLLERYIEKGRRFFLSKMREPLLSPFGKRTQLPRMLYLGERHEIFDALLSRPGQHTWYRDWTARALDLTAEEGGINAVLQAAVRRLAEVGLVAVLPSGRSQAAALDPQALRATREVARVACAACGVALTLHRAEAERWFGRPCLSFRCGGTYAPIGGEQREDSYYRRLYRGGEIERIFSSEHTGLLDRPVREALERDFKTRPRPDSPNLLTCTPTLEMGIDIGDLSYVVLCSVPPLPANYLQRVGRAGRKTGNAAVLAMVTSRGHDLYFNDEPLEMIRGEVTPPGCFLDAPEVLVRQMLAHAMDQWARTGAATRIPHQMRLISSKPKDDAFPYSFFRFYEANRDALLERFMELFADQLTPESTQRLRDAARSGQLLDAVRAAFASVQDERKQIRKRLDELDARVEALEKDPSLAAPSEEQDVSDAAAEEISEIRDAHRAYVRILEELGNKHPLNVLTDAGILPNYAFPEPGVTLKTLLRGPKGDGGGKDSGGKDGGGKDGAGQRRTQRFEYMRPASTAIRELAPFNTFYAEGHKVKVSQIDVGTRASPLMEAWRLCPSCHHAERLLAEGEPPPACPKCDDPHYKDQGQRRYLVHFRQAWSVMDLMEATTADDTEERDEVRYRTLELIDVESRHQRGGWLVQGDGLVFGYELLQGVTLRELNLGVMSDTGQPVEIAGEKVAQRGFLVCRDCGKVQSREGREAKPQAQHAPYCRVRTGGAAEHLETVCLYRELTSEAIRVLLPVSESEFGIMRLLPSVRAALLLGFRQKFKGQASHLEITTASETVGGTKRHYLVIYDRVPGGTGYLSELVKGDPATGGGLLEVMELSARRMRDCRCAGDPDRDGCYRCVYAYQESRSLPYISRRAAVDVFEEVLAARGQMRRALSLGDVSIDSVLESELERRFLDAIAKHAREQRWSFESVPVRGKPARRLTLPGLTWQIEPQVDLGPGDAVDLPSRPDFIARCTSRDDVLPIAIFCDGLAYHALPDDAEGRIWDDLAKRTAILRSERFWVWSVTWKDVEDVVQAGQRGTTTLFAGAKAAQRDQALGVMQKRQERPIPKDLWGLGSMELLLRFLADPDAALWRDAARAIGVGALHMSPALSTTDVQRLRRALAKERDRVELTLERAKAPEGVVGGHEARAFAELLVEIPREALVRTQFEELRFQIRLFDDRASRAAEGFEESWRAALHALNLLQFHGPVGVAATCTEWIARERAGDSVIPPPDPTKRPLSENPAAEGADDRLLAVSQNFPEARALCLVLLERGLPAPREFTGWQTDRIELDAMLAWTEHKIALWCALEESDRIGWQAIGWQVFDLDIDPPTVIADALAAAMASRSFDPSAAER